MTERFEVIKCVPSDVEGILETHRNKRCRLASAVNCGPPNYMIMMIFDYDWEEEND